MRVYLRHQRAAKICTTGARHWFRMRNLDWRDYLKNGVSADVLRELNDPIANRALAEALKESQHGR